MCGVKIDTVEAELNQEGVNWIFKIYVSILFAQPLARFDVPPKSVISMYEPKQRPAGTEQSLAPSPASVFQ